MRDDDGKIIWQYSEEWQRRMGIFSGPSDASPDVPDPGEVEGGTSERSTGTEGFVPARDKLEAVNRISSRAGGPPQALGPGSTERKEVLEVAARFVGVAQEEMARPKPALGGAIVAQLGGIWTPGCFSTGSTVTLLGLNTILELLETRPTASTAGAGPRPTTPGDEAEIILQEALRHVPAHFEGREAVELMRQAESSDWAQSEWPGFFFEFLALGPCINVIGGGPVKSPSRSIFDLGGEFVWDFKVHSLGQPWAILNDREAVDWALDQKGGVGLVIASGEPTYDTTFKEWFDAYKIRNGKPPRPRARAARYSRTLKSAFELRRVDVVFFDADDWDAALRTDAVRVWDQPSQPDGRPRRQKYQLHVDKAVARWTVAHAIL